MNSARPLIVQRIAQAGLGFQTVRGTGNIRGVLRQAWPVPACFVWLVSQDNRDDNDSCLLQMDSTYVVLFILELEKDDGSVEDAGELLAKEVRALLHGYAPFDMNKLRWRSTEVFTELPEKSDRNRLFVKNFYTLKQHERIT